jgi:invasion protein IalB
MTLNRNRILGLSSVTVVALAIAGAAAFYASPGDANTATIVHAATDHTADLGNARLNVAVKNDAGMQFAQAQAPAGTAPTPSTLPGGATSINETYRDWSVACVQQGAGKRCAMSQVQTQQNGQRVLAIEISPPQGSSTTGALALPFGLALANGITLQIDDKPAMVPLRFRTCLPTGCIVPLSFDAAAIVALRAGTSLKVKATTDGGSEAPFTISLAGFAAALDRVAALAR